MNLPKQSATGLEQFDQCPLAFKNIPFDPPIKGVISMFVGDICHASHQYPEHGKNIAEDFCKNTVKELTGKKDNILLDQIRKIISLTQEFMENCKENGDQLIFEAKLAKMINGVYITTTPDCIKFKNDGGVDVIDFKIGVDRKYYKHEGKFQTKLYSYLIMDLYDLDKVNFSYLVYEKKTEPRMAWITEEYSYEYSKKEVERVIREYSIAYNYDVWVPKKGEKCYAFGGCPLKKAESAEKIGCEQCPLFIDQSQITSTEGSITF